MKSLKKILSAVLTAVMVFSTVSCSKSESSTENANTQGVRVDKGNDIPDNVSVSEEQMPYGATMLALFPENDENVKIPVEFDKRFFSSDENGNYPELYRVSDYFVSLNQNDKDLFTEVFYKPYLEFAVNETGFSDIESYFNDYHDYMTKSLGEGFEVDYIIIESLETKADNPERFSQLDERLSNIDKDISQKIDEGSEKYITLECTYNINGEGSYAFSYRLDETVSLYLYTIDGVAYIV